MSKADAESKEQDDQSCQFIVGNGLDRAGKDGPDVARRAAEKRAKANMSEGWVNKLEGLKGLCVRREGRWRRRTTRSVVLIYMGPNIG